MVGSAVGRIHEALRQRGSQQRRNNWQCPAHDDRTPSLTVSQGREGAVVYCHAGCDAKDVTLALGLSPADLFDSNQAHQATTSPSPSKRRPRRVAEYVYTDRQGEPVRKKVRIEPGTDGRPKSFRWEMAGGTRCQRGEGNPHVLYELPLVVEAEVVHINEGEKAANALNSYFAEHGVMGHVATCAPATSWETGFTDALRGKRVVVWIDRDAEGEKQAKAVCEALATAGIDFERARSRVLEDKADAFDHLAGGFAPDDASHEEAEPEAPEFLRGSMTLASAQPLLELAGTLVRGILDRGVFALLFSPPGGAKTFLALHLAACIATGRDFLTYPASTVGVVLYLVGEGGKRFANRLAAWRAKYPGLSGYQRLIAVPLAGVDLASEEGEAELLLAVQHVSATVGSVVLVVADTLGRLTQGDENSPTEMGRLVAATDRVRETTGTAFLWIHHTGHSNQQRPRGHSSLHGAADTELTITVDDKNNVYWLVTKKQRDMEPAPRQVFALESVEIGETAGGEPVRSAVVAHCVQPAREPEGPSAQAKVVIDLTARVPKRDIPEDVRREHGAPAKGWNLDDLRKQGRDEETKGGTPQQVADRVRKAVDRGCKNLRDEKRGESIGGWLWLLT